MKTREHVLAIAALALLAVVNFAWFPGHTWLQSDTQIYIAIFEHLWDPSVLAKDPVAVRPHVKWTIYDEAAILGRVVSGSGFREVLLFMQLMCRFCGLLGVFLLSKSVFSSTFSALFVASSFGLGAVINGPAVLTFEYEPVPRGFAVMLLMAALGCLARGRRHAAGVFATLATLFHPTTMAPFWICAVLWWLMRRRDRTLLVYGFGAAMLLLLAAALQRGETEPQVLFGRVGPDLAYLQRYRGAYNWITLWPRSWLWQYPFLFGVVVLAWWRLRAALPPAVSFFSIALPAYGLLMIPASWLLLDVGKWSFIPQAQPARAVLFITAFAVILAALAAWRAALERRWWESAAWLFIVFAVPANGRVLELFYSLRQPEIQRRMLFVLLLAGGCALLLLMRRGAFVLAAAALPLLILPGPAGIRNYPELHQPELDELIEWARGNTSVDDVFQFADVHRDLAPGIFRARALRNLYTDWKSGGQVNLLERFAFEWWRRWKAVNEARPPLRRLESYRELGIDYLVIRPAHRPSGVEPVFANRRYEVLDLRKQ